MPGLSLSDVVVIQYSGSELRLQQQNQIITKGYIIQKKLGHHFSHHFLIS